jgi:prophage lp2 protein 40
MALFDTKNFNGEVFGAYVDAVPNLNRNELLKSGAIVEKPQYATMLPDQTGGNYITIPIKARIGGTADNYDGNTDITADSRDTYTHGRIVVGRAHGWTEKDFSSDITGEDFMPAAQEVAEYWDDVDQETLLCVLKGIFSMTGQKNKDFVNDHTYDVSMSATETGFAETTLNNAIQQALGDNKGKFSLAIMHSKIATNLENLKLIAYMKYNDGEGIERDLTLATLNGRTVLIDDNMPTTSLNAKYVKAAKTDPGALKVTTAGSGEGEVAKTTVQSDVTDVKEGDYVVLLPAGTAYTTYVLGNGAIEYTNCGAKVPYEMDRDPKEKGGEDTLYSRQRKIFSPYGISFKTPSFISPTNSQLESGDNWELANNNSTSTKKYFPIKAIPIARIITR